MKHFLVEVTYLVPHEQMLAVRPEHRAYLQKGYDGGLLLLSGAQTSGKGGVVIARAESRLDIEEFFKHDPYGRERIAEFRIIEFVPAQFQDFLKTWI